MSDVAERGVRFVLSAGVDPSSPGTIVQLGRSLDALDASSAKLSAGVTASANSISASLVTVTTSANARIASVVAASTAAANKSTASLEASYAKRNVLMAKSADLGTKELGVVKELGEAQKKLADSMVSLADKSKSGIAVTEAETEAVVAQAKAYEDLVKKHESLIGATQELRKEMKASGDALKDAKPNAVSLGKSLDEAGSASDKLSGGLDRVKNASKQLGEAIGVDFSSATEQLENLLNTVEKVKSVDRALGGGGGLLKNNKTGIGGLANAAGTSIAGALTTGAVGSGLSSLGMTGIGAGAAGGMGVLAAGAAAAGSALFALVSAFEVARSAFTGKNTDYTERMGKEGGWNPFSRAFANATGGGRDGTSTKGGTLLDVGRSIIDPYGWYTETTKETAEKEQTKRLSRSERNLAQRKERDLQDEQSISEQQRIIDTAGSRKASMASSVEARTFDAKSTGEKSVEMASKINSLMAESVKGNLAAFEQLDQWQTRRLHNEKEIASVSRQAATDKLQSAQRELSLAEQTLQKQKDFAASAEERFAMKSEEDQQRALATRESLRRGDKGVEIADLQNVEGLGAETDVLVRQAKKDRAKAAGFDAFGAENNTRAAEQAVQAATVTVDQQHQVIVKIDQNFEQLKTAVAEQMVEALKGQDKVIDAAVKEAVEKMEHVQTLRDLRGKQ